MYCCFFLPVTTAVCQYVCVCAFDAGDLYLMDNSFEDNEATNGAAVYAVQGCGQVLVCLHVLDISASSTKHQPKKVVSMHSKIL